ncbi:MAG: ROK family protein [Christensenellales bacterium]|jgi:predicted NBD/HSP70 family sugar kinase
MIDIHRYRDDATLKKKVLQTIYERGQVSRGELTEILGMGLTSVTKYVGSLLGEGIIIECGAMESAVGRKPNLLGINPEYAYILGADIGGYAAKLGVVRMDGSIVEDWFIRPLEDKVPVTSMEPDGLIRFIARIFKKYGRDRFMAICVGISGMVDHEKGTVVFCPNLSGWDDVNLADLLTASFGLPAFVDTSARCMALAEQRYGAGTGVRDQVFVSLGYYGIGSALIMNGSLYRGYSGFAGEIGHVMSSNRGVRCTCGNYDCLELSSTLKMIVVGISRRLKGVQGYSPLLRLLPQDWSEKDITPQIIGQAIEEGDKLCYEAVETAGRHTGIALSNLLNVINPGLVILGGSVIELFPGMLDIIGRTIRERVLVPVLRDLEVRKAKMDWRGAVVGSSVMAQMEFFR